MKLHEAIKEKMGVDNHILATCYHGIKLDFYDYDGTLTTSTDDTVHDMVNGINAYRFIVNNLDVSVDTFQKGTSNYIHVVLEPKKEQEQPNEEPKWEDTEEYKEWLEEYNRRIELFDVFERKFTHYILYNSNADVEVFKVWKAIQNFINSSSDPDDVDDCKAGLIGFFEEFWFAWLEDILDGEYKYMNLTSIVWDSLEN